MRGAHDFILSGTLVPWLLSFAFLGLEQKSRPGISPSKRKATRSGERGAISQEHISGHEFVGGWRGWAMVTD